MVAGTERSRVPDLAEERVGAGILAAYLILWAGLTAGALFLWPDVVDVPGVTPWSALPLLIAYHLRRGSAAAWTWGLAFHGSVSLGVTALGIAHAALNEVDPFLFAYAAGSWIVTVMLYQSRREGALLVTRGWAVFLAVVGAWSAWTGLQAAREAQAEFPRNELLAARPWPPPESLPEPRNMSFFARGEPALIASAEREGVPWAIYTYQSRHGGERCIAFTEGKKHPAGSCPLDFVAPDHVMSLLYSEARSGNVVYGVVSRRVRGLELRFPDGEVESVPIVVPPSGAGLDVNVFVAFLPEGVGSEEYEISAFDDEGKRIDQLGYLD